MEANVTKRTDDYILIFWEDDWEFGNIKIERDGNGMKVDSECIGFDKFLKVMRNIN